MFKNKNAAVLHQFRRWQDETDESINVSELPKPTSSLKKLPTGKMGRAAKGFVLEKARKNLFVVPAAPAKTTVIVDPVDSCFKMPQIPVTGKVKVAGSSQVVKYDLRSKQMRMKDDNNNFVEPESEPIITPELRQDILTLQAYFKEMEEFQKLQSAAKKSAN